MFTRLPAGASRVNGQVAGLFELGGMGNPNLTGREYAVRYLQFMGVAERGHLPTLWKTSPIFPSLGDAFDQRIRTYSSGMAARLYFAVATAYQHEIYLIDELLSVGDEHFQAKCWQRMRGAAVEWGVWRSGYPRLDGDRQALRAGLRDRGWPVCLHRRQAMARCCQLSQVANPGSWSGAIPGIAANSSLSCNPGRSRPFALPGRNSGRCCGRLCDFDRNVASSALAGRFVILSDWIPCWATAAGSYSVEFKIPALPLAPGKYSLNLFLSLPPAKGGRQG
jgi:hypothetical protein